MMWKWNLSLCFLIGLLFASPLPGATVDGIEIHSSVQAEGTDTVILVHGWTCDSTIWKSQVPAVRQGRNGRWMAYTSNESGKDEIYVRPFPDVNKGGKWQTSTDGGDSPLWSTDGRELFYRNGDEVMAIAVETEPTFKAGKPETLFGGTYTSLSMEENHPWDISPNGKFLMMKEVASTSETAAAETPRKINIVVNWLEELKERVPIN